MGSELTLALLFLPAQTKLAQVKRQSGGRPRTHCADTLHDPSKVSLGRKDAVDAGRSSA